MIWCRLQKFEIYVPFLFLAWGLFFTFRYFWTNSGIISGDLGDARFNTIVLEHTWLWIRGIHPSLFDLPIYFPHPNVYAYSDFLIASAPLYWSAKIFGAESLLAFQLWVIACATLNFVAFYWLSRKQFQFSIFFSALASYFFAFALPRTVQLGHAQLIPEFYSVIAAFGALSWWKNPKSTFAPYLFFFGTVLQLLNSFYFFWFWIWTLAIYAICILVSSERRKKFGSWVQNIDLKTVSIPLLISASLAFPFVWHYLQTAKELGMRGWVSITVGLPRIYSWFALPHDHWEWNFTPFKEALEQLPHSIWVEHYLSFGMLTWAIVLFALFSAYRKPNERFLTLPVLAMFILSFCVGRLSLWIFMAYLFPGGGAIRAASRIQIYMLLFWAVLFGSFLQATWNKNFESKFKFMLAALIILFFAENTYTGTLPHLSFDRLSENSTIEKIIAKIPMDCEVLYYAGTEKKSIDLYQIDAMRAAFESNRSTINGYSGNQPKDYLAVFSNQAFTADQKLTQWISLNPDLQNHKICKVDYVD